MRNHFSDQSILYLHPSSLTSKGFIRTQGKCQQGGPVPALKKFIA